MSTPNTEILEEKKDVLERVPPGDRWKSLVTDTDEIFESLTEALEYHYQETGETQFYISARDGLVQVVMEREVTKEPVVRKFSLYGED